MNTPLPLPTILADSGPVADMLSAGHLAMHYGEHSIADSNSIRDYALRIAARRLAHDLVDLHGAPDLIPRDEAEDAIAELLDLEGDWSGIRRNSDFRRVRALVAEALDE